MLGNQSSAYDPVAYNNGGVWPFLTGFVSCAEYEYRRPHSAFAHLNQLVNLTFEHALGVHPEILSGDYYRPLDESVPHQLFSSGMVITPFIRGLLGLRPDAPTRTLRFAPQIPAAWDRLRVRNYRVGPSSLSLSFKRMSTQNVRFEITKDDNKPLKIQFAPALPALAKISKLLVDGKSVKPVTCKLSTVGAGCNLDLQLRRQTTIEFILKGGIELDVPYASPEIGARTTSLKVLEVSTMGPNRLAAKLEGIAGQNYTLRVRGGSIVQDVKFGTRNAEKNGWTLIEVVIPSLGNREGYQRRDIELVLK
jgi:hypothetical protein